MTPVVDDRPTKRSESRHGLPTTSTTVAFVLPWAIARSGGVNQVVENLLDELKNDKCQSVVIENDWHCKQPVIEEHRGYTRIRVRLPQPYEIGTFRELIGALLQLPSTVFHLWRLVRQHTLKVINVHYPGLTALHWVLLKALGLYRGRLVLSFHGGEIRSAYSWSGWPRAAYRLLLRSADSLVSCSKGLQDEVIAFEPQCAARANVIYNGIDPSRFMWCDDSAQIIPGAKN